MCVSKSSPPDLPPPPAAAQAPRDQGSQSMYKGDMGKNKRRAAASTILTGAQGLTGTANTGKTLLGGSA